MKDASEHTQHWEEKFRTRAWGRYPPEDLVRFACKAFSVESRKDRKVLEIGCGPGANVWFLHREGFRVSGIDSSATAVQIATDRIKSENKEPGLSLIDLRVGNFSTLPWPSASFDMVIDIFALYANPREVISSTLDEVSRVLVPGGLFYSKLWGQRTTGYGEGSFIEDGTFEDIDRGPCAGMGITHFFTLDEIRSVFRQFEIVSIEVVTRSRELDSITIEEFHCQFRKPA